MSRGCRFSWNSRPEIDTVKGMWLRQKQRTKVLSVEVHFLSKRPQQTLLRETHTHQDWRIDEKRTLKAGLYTNKNLQIFWRENRCWQNYKNKN